MHRVRPFRYRGPLFTRESIQSSEGLSASLRVRQRPAQGNSSHHRSTTHPPILRAANAASSWCTDCGQGPGRQGGRRAAESVDKLGVCAATSAATSAFEEGTSTSFLFSPRSLSFF